LPATAVVCEEPVALRCWQAARESDCAASGGGGRTFRIVIDSSRDLAEALEQCRAALAGHD